MHLQLAPRSMTLDDRELLLSSNSLENFRMICQIWEATAAKQMKKWQFSTSIQENILYKVSIHNYC